MPLPRISESHWFRHVTRWRNKSRIRSPRSNDLIWGHAQGCKSCLPFSDALKRTSSAHKQFEVFSIYFLKEYWCKVLLNESFAIVDLTIKLYYWYFSYVVTYVLYVRNGHHHDIFVTKILKLSSPRPIQPSQTRWISWLNRCTCETNITSVFSFCSTTGNPGSPQRQKILQNLIQKSVFGH